jgi:hypothetical protein
MQSRGRFKVWTSSQSQTAKNGGVGREVCKACPVPILQRNFHGRFRRTKSPPTLSPSSNAQPAVGSLTTTRQPNRPSSTHHILCISDSLLYKSASAVGFRPHPCAAPLGKQHARCALRKLQPENFQSCTVRCTLCNAYRTTTSADPIHRNYVTLSARSHTSPGSLLVCSRKNPDKRWKLTVSGVKPLVVRKIHTAICAPRARRAHST